MEEKVVPQGTDTLVKKTANVIVGEQTYQIATFKFGKMVRALALVAEVAAAAGIEDATKKLMGNGEDGENITVAGILGQVVNVLPKLLKDGVPGLYKLIGLVLTPNKELYKMETDDDADVDKALFIKGRDVAWEAEPQEVMNILSMGVQQIGVETILGNLTPLVSKLLNR